MPKIVIPEGESCVGCRFIRASHVIGIYQCVMFSVLIDDKYSKCQQCLNKEPIIIQYGEADEKKTE